MYSVSSLLVFAPHGQFHARRMKGNAEQSLLVGTISTIEINIDSARPGPTRPSGGPHLLLHRRADRHSSLLPLLFSHCRSYGRIENPTGSPLAKHRSFVLDAFFLYQVQSPVRTPLGIRSYGRRFPWKVSLIRALFFLLRHYLGLRVTRAATLGTGTPFTGTTSSASAWSLAGITPTGLVPTLVEMELRLAPESVTSRVTCPTFDPAETHFLAPRSGPRGERKHHAVGPAASVKPRAAVRVWGGKPQPSGPAPATPQQILVKILLGLGKNEYYTKRPRASGKCQRQRKGSGSENGPAPAEGAVPAKKRGSGGSIPPVQPESVTCDVTLSGAGRPSGRDSISFPAVPHPSRLGFADVSFRGRARLRPLLGIRQSFKEKSPFDSGLDRGIGRHNMQSTMP
ncbi:hypothetical protein DFH06DRAFT_1154001 [Mycena polygramma]|nr:hypothetical protein DFH06DRAFT_1154001 [Mycena polygramma]